MDTTQVDNGLLQEHFGQRIEWVDVCKGVLIAFMVIGHSSSPISRWIYLFHMPAFMFISGYTANPGKYSFGKFFLKKVRRILVPYVVWNLGFITFYRFLSGREIFVLFDQPFSITVSDFFKNLWTTDLGGATWFLAVIFEIAVIYESIYHLFRLAGRVDAVPCAAMVIGCMGYWLCNEGNYLPYDLDLSLYGLLYFAMGDLCAKKRILEDHIPARPMLVICVAVSIVFGCLYPELMMNWPTRSFVGLLENVVSTACGVYMCYRTAQWLCGSERLKRVSKFYGRHTLLIVVSHFAAFRLIFACFVALGIEPVEYLRNLTPQGARPMEWFVVSVGALLICGAAAKLMDMAMAAVLPKAKVTGRKGL